MTKKETEIRKLFNTYIEETSKMNVAKTFASEAKAKLMQLIPENETLFDVHYTSSFSMRLNNNLYVKKLFELIPKTKQKEAKEIKSTCLTKTPFNKIVPAKPEKD